ncbi:MAG TPA: GAF domain-containing protein [Noviherbaspirillum sp.]|uniref:GAF domain-containing protein n=1 Tax=Noviherbaspirillum sp. TaxID=1926288 RepID=UPI002DDD1229|nr:GAF domain-containing protein [Noviherbaspirillum sp.]HEV2612616.1 GAF domain-containing protein [Noviherbaspirillum sp.]
MKQTPVTGQKDDPILTTRETARLLGVAVSTAQLWIESGALASWKTPGGHRRVRLSSVMDLLQQQGGKKQSGATEAPDAEALDPEYSPLPQAAYPMPADEDERLRALAASRLIDTPEEPAFDRLTRLACQFAETPMALVSLLTSRRQWFKSRVGLDACETPREWAFCSHAIMHRTPLVVEDAHQDERFKNNPLVTGEPFIRFYAGFPLLSKQSLRLGTLCVLDTKPRQLTPEQIRALGELACIASEEIQRRE